MPDMTNPELNPPIDFPSVLERIGGDSSFLQELLQLYFQEFAEKRQLLEVALREGDATKIQEVGHSLKGASANLSLGSLQRLGLAIETAGREGNLDRAKEAIGALEGEFQRLKAFLEIHPPAELG